MDDEHPNRFIRREREHEVHLRPEILMPERRYDEDRQYRREHSAPPGEPAGANIFVNPPPPPSPPRVFALPRSPSPPRNPRGFGRGTEIPYRSRRHSRHRRASPEPIRINIDNPRPEGPDVTFLAQHYFESGGGIGDLEFLRQRFGPGRERKKIGKLRKHRKPEDGPVVCA
jgi:hypothetical protein